MQLSFSAPSKTFLVGEYAILAGGPALTVATAPRFELKIKPGQFVPHFHPQSPAGIWLTAHEAIFQDHELEFIDPYAGSGGFGASSAQFILTVCATNTLAQTKTPLTANYFRDCFATTQTTTPKWPQSGADIITQTLGQICQIKADKSTVTATWPFQALDFVLLKTPHKIATHDHLAQLQSLPSTALTQLSTDALHAFNEANSEAFIHTINAFAELLAKYQLTCPQTQTALKALLSQPETLAAKGCGALGADVILVVCASHHIDKLCAYARQLNMQPIATSQNITEGLHIHE